MTKKSTHAHADPDVTVDDIVEDLRAVVRDAEALLHATQGHAGERIEEIRARAEETIGSAKERLRDAGAGVGEKARAAAKSTDDFVHENPWRAVAIAAAIGFLLGGGGRRN